MNVFDFLFENRPPAATPALISPGGVKAYGELLADVDAVAALLSAAGLEPGDRCLLVAENSFFWVAAYLAALKVGGTAVPLPPTISSGDCAAIVGSTTPRAGLIQGKLAAGLREALAGVPSVIVDAAADPLEPVLSFETARARPGGPTVRAHDGFDDRRHLAALMFTSGSTGAPRGVMVTHRNLIANTAAIVEYLELGADDRMMAVLPFHYCYGTSLLHTHLRAGGSLVLDNRFMFPDRVLRAMQDTGCTGFAGVPATFQLLLRSSSLKRMRFPALRTVQQAGGRLAQPLIQELRRTLPGARLFVMYGQTEATARLSYLPPEMLDEKPGSIGRGIPGVRLTVLDETGEPVVPGSGAVGEIVAEGENVAAGYWRAPEETRAVFRAGRLHTGDLATIDEDGYITVVDRAREFLKLGGHRVACARIEETLLAFPGTREAAVVGIPDDWQGEAVLLVIAHPEGDNILPALSRYCTERLPVHERPKRIVVRAELPKTGAGKIDRVALKREAKTACETPPRSPTDGRA